MLLYVLAQAVVAAAPVPASTPAVQPPAATGASQTGVVSYPPDFFTPGHPDTALDMINYLPGFQLDSGSGVRGYEGAAGNVLINGQRPAAKTEGLGSILQRMQVGQVERIDVIRGGAPGIDMQGKTVIANVITKSSDAARGMFHYARDTLSDGRSMGTLRLEGSGQSGPRSWEAGLTAAGFFDDGHGDGPLRQLNPNGSTALDGHIHDQGWGTQVTGTAAGETPFAGGRLRLNARLASQVYDSSELDTIRIPDNHTVHDHQDDNWFQSEFGARYSRDFSARTSTELVALRQGRTELYADDFRPVGDVQDFRLRSRTSESILRGVLKHQWSSALSVEGGVEGAYNTLTSQTRFTDNGAPVALPAADVTVDETRGEGFVKAVWRPFSTLTIEGALREEGSKITSSGDVTLEKTLYFTKPRLAVTWAPDADTQVRLRYEREVGQLDFGNFVASTTLVAGVVSAGNPNLEPQQDWASEIAVERRFWGSGGLVLTARHLQITDAIDRAPVRAADGSFFDSPANIGDGWENDALVNLTLPLDKLGLKGALIRGDYTRRWSEVTDPTTHQRRPITQLHPNDWDFHYSQPVGRWLYGVDIGGGWQQRYYRFNQIEIDKLGNYVTPYAEWKPNPTLSWRFELDNVARRGFKHTFENFDGPRNLFPLSLVETRNNRPARVFHIRLRKTFGG